MKPKPSRAARTTASPSAARKPKRPRAAAPPPEPAALEDPQAAARKEKRDADLKVEQHSIALIKKGDNAEKERFIRANQGLVVYIAKKYAFYPDILPDLIAEGNMGLLKALEKYDPGRNVKFGTYAYFWIKRFVLRAIMKDFEMFKIPERVQEFREKMEDVRRSYQLEKGRQPDINEISRELKIPVEIVKKLKRYSEQVRIFAAESADNDRGGDLFDVLDYRRKEEPVLWRILQNNDLLEKILVRLRSREKRANIDTWLKILRLHFGLDNGVPHSYKEIAEKLDVSRQRVHQIIKICVKKLQKEWKEIEDERSDSEPDRDDS